MLPVSFDICQPLPRGIFLYQTQIKHAHKHRCTHIQYVLYMTQTWELSDTHTLKPKERPLPPIFTHTPLKEAVLSAAPWHINQMDCGGNGDVGGGGGRQRRESSHCMEGNIDLSPPHLTSGILYTLGPCMASVTIHLLGVENLQWLSQRGEWNLRKTKKCCPLMGTWREW